MRIFRATICRVVLSLLLLLKMSVSGACCCSGFAAPLANTTACARTCDCCCKDATRTGACCHRPDSREDAEDEECNAVLNPGCAANCDCDFIHDGRLPFLSRATEKGFEHPSEFNPGLVNTSLEASSPAVPNQNRVPRVTDESTHNGRQARLCVWRN
jgi:hypothetical protein